MPRNRKPTASLTAVQLDHIILAMYRDLLCRLERRHCWRRPIGDLPARPDYVTSAYSDIREIISAIRILKSQHSATWLREWNLRAAA